jgi:hypothetical protein
MSTLVSRGREPPIITSQLSNPMTATSSGTRRPSSRSASSTPRAIWSLPHSSASMPASRASSACAAVSPQLSDHSP